MLLMCDVTVTAAPFPQTEGVKKFDGSSTSVKNGEKMVPSASKSLVWEEFAGGCSDSVKLTFVYVLNILILTNCY